MFWRVKGVEEFTVSVEVCDLKKMRSNSGCDVWADKLNLKLIKILQTIKGTNHFLYTSGAHMGVYFRSATTAMP